MTIVGIGELIGLLHRKVIHGFLLNKQMYYDFLKDIKKLKYKQQALINRNVQMVQMEMVHKGDRLAYGMLVKHYDHYEYFRKYFENSWLHLQACHNIKNNRQFYLMPKHESGFFTPEAGLFFPFLYYSLGILSLVFCFGVIYEMIRHRIVS